MELKVIPLDNDHRDDFYSIHNEAYNAGWCYCVAWWTTTWEAWGMRTGEENRQRREQLFEQEMYDGYLLYADGKPVGWCQCLPRDYLMKLIDEYKLAPDPETWAITCFLIIPEYREIGLAHYFLGEILKDLRRRGVYKVQAFPKRGQNLAADNVWTGPESIYVKAGFELEIDQPTFPVYSKNLS